MLDGINMPVLLRFVISVIFLTIPIKTNTTQIVQNINKSEHYRRKNKHDIDTFCLPRQNLSVMVKFL